MVPDTCVMWIVLVLSVMWIVLVLTVKTGINCVIILMPIKNKKDLGFGLNIMTVLI